MNSPVLWLAVGLAAGVLIGRQLCPAAPTHATTGDVLAGLVKLGDDLGGKVVTHFWGDKAA